MHHVTALVCEGARMRGEVADPSDGDDFNAWVRPHLPSMTRFAARLVATADRDDVVQDALVRAWKRRSTFDPRRGTPVGWLLAIVADQARKRRPSRHLSLITEDAPTIPSGIERRVDLERAIADLAPRQQLAVNLHYFVGLDITTCAEAMRCAEGTVKATLHQARLRLHEALGDENHG
jgi:RNA polymerase sigma factor (sigma-70 family)